MTSPTGQMLMPAAGKRYFYNTVIDKLIVTDEGSVPPKTEDENTAAEWTELDEHEGE